MARVHALFIQREPYSSRDALVREKQLNKSWVLPTRKLRYVSVHRNAARLYYAATLFLIYVIDRRETS